MEISRARFIVTILVLSALAAFCGWKSGTSRQKERCTRLIDVSREVLRNDSATYGFEPLTMNGLFYSRLQDAMGECSA
jgi:hypothetical protein